MTINFAVFWKVGKTIVIKPVSANVLSSASGVRRMIEDLMRYVDDWRDKNEAKE